METYFLIVSRNAQIIAVIEKKTGIAEKFSAILKFVAVEKIDRKRGVRVYVNAP